MLLQAIQADPATTIEGYLAVRSALMRLLDPGAMGRFRVMAFGRGLAGRTAIAGFDYRLRPTAPPTPRAADRRRTDRTAPDRTRE